MMREFLKSEMNLALYCCDGHAFAGKSSRIYMLGRSCLEPPILGQILFSCVNTQETESRLI